jgi:hypothetical protein
MARHHLFKRRQSLLFTRAAVKTTPKPAGPPEVTFEGKFWYTGGTGKFEGITGGGTYKNTLTPSANYEFEGQYTLKR